MFLMRGCVGLAGVGGEVDVGPLVGAAAEEQVAPGGLAAVEAVAHEGDVEERLQGGGGNDLDPCGRHWNVDADHLRQQRGLGAGGGYHRAGSDVAGGRPHRCDPAAGDVQAGDGGVLVEPAAEVLEGPCEGLDGALGVGVAAVGEERAAQGPIGDAWNEVLYLPLGLPSRRIGRGAGLRPVPRRCRPFPPRTRPPAACPGV